MNKSLNNTFNTKFRVMVMHTQRQSGMALFIALVALAVMSLAAVALIRSVDTNTIIAGNVALKQAATTSADFGTEQAITKIAQIRDSSGLNAINNDNHPINKTDLNTNPGYHSRLLSSTDAGFLNLKAAATWDDTNKNNVLVGTDASGNEVRYLIQRMCRFPNQAPASTTLGDADCVYSAGEADDSGQEIKLGPEICTGDGCPTAGQSPLLRVTVRVKDPRDSITYVQAVVH